MTPFVRLMRIRQWIKNLLVFAAPAAAGVLFEPDAFEAALWAFLAFSLAASGVYVLNDLRDSESDRAHPVKRSRPIAAGEVSPTAALVLAMALIVSAGAVAWFFLPLELLAVLSAYVVNTLVYTLWGKHIPIVDVMQVALGFVLRAVAGAAATGVPLSQWFLAAAMFGSLLMVAGKRSSELEHVGDGAGTRTVLTSYNAEYLHQIMVISASGLLLTYALWALGDVDTPIRHPWALVSFAPFVYSVFRYMFLSDQGQAEQPEKLWFVDSGLRLGAVVWLATIAFGIYT